MVVFEASTFLVIAAVVGVVWRWSVWRRRGGDVVREVVVAALMVWALLVVRVVYFPMTIIFYDWTSGINLVPLQSIFQLIAETPVQVAVRNIAGNVVMFAPFGFLLPVLFVKSRSAWAVLWRAAVVSAAIEITQVMTRARSIDVDDVILNITGALVGYGLFAVFSRLALRVELLERLLSRAGSAAPSEPLLAPVIPILITAAIVLPMMIGSIFDATLGEGPNGIVGTATGGIAGVEVVTRADIEEHTFLITRGPAMSGAELSLVQFERVLPGRYVWVGTSDALPTGSTYDWAITAFNVVRGEVPIVVVWGANPAAASEVDVSGNGVTERLSIPAGPEFVIGFPFDVETKAPGERLADFAFEFYDSSGREVTEQFALRQR